MGNGCKKPDDNPLHEPSMGHSASTLSEKTSGNPSKDKSGKGGASNSEKEPATAQSESELLTEPTKKKSRFGFPSFRGVNSDSEMEPTTAQPESEVLTKPRKKSRFGLPSLRGVKVPAFKLKKLDSCILDEETASEFEAFRDQTRVGGAIFDWFKTQVAYSKENLGEEELTPEEIAEAESVVKAVLAATERATVVDSPVVAEVAASVQETEVWHSPPGSELLPTWAKTYQEPPADCSGCYGCQCSKCTGRA